MSLVTRNPGDTIRSLDVDQLVNLLTGLMADQAVALPNLTINGPLTVNAVTGPTISSAPLTGAGGATQWWFAIVPVVSGVDAPPGPIFKATVLGPATLTGTNYFTANFPNAPGATAYKIIGGTGASAPAYSAMLLVGASIPAVNGQAVYTMPANAAGSAYTAVTVPIGGTAFGFRPFFLFAALTAPGVQANGFVGAFNLSPSTFTLLAPCTVVIVGLAQGDTATNQTWGMQTLVDSGGMIYSSLSTTFGLGAGKMQVQPIFGHIHLAAGVHTLQMQLQVGGGGVTANFGAAFVYVIAVAP